MNFAVILSGGVGLRMKSNLPKQYIEINGKPIIAFALEAYQKSDDIDGIVIVAAEQWREKILEWNKMYGITKFLTFADAGFCRQASIRNGVHACMEYSKSDKDGVLVHDAVRPFISGEIISACVKELDSHEGSIPIVPIADTVYQTFDGRTIANVPVRSTLAAAQTPETFTLRRYDEINMAATDEELEKCISANMIALSHGFDVVLIPGEHRNFKVTTPEDLVRCRLALEKNDQ